MMAKEIELETERLVLEKDLSSIPIQNPEELRSENRCGTMRKSRIIESLERNLAVSVKMEAW